MNWGTKLKVTVNFLLKTMQVRRQQKNIFKVLKENMMDTGSIPLKNEGDKLIFSDI